MSGPSFAGAVDYGSGGFNANSVAVADVNGDGKPDLLVANGCGSSSTCGNATVGVLLGNGDGTFQTAVAYPSGGLGAVSLALADVNGDGKLDLLVANSITGTVGVLLGNGDGTFQTAMTYGSGGVQPESVAVADVNEDGKPDLLVANYCAVEGYCGLGGLGGSVGVLLGNGDGTFQTAVAYSSGGIDAVSVTVADVNGDGKPDLLVASTCSGNCANGGLVSVFLGNGDGTFRGPVVYGSGGLAADAAAVADVNEDGKQDLLVANSSASRANIDGTVGVLLGNGDGTFQSAVPYYSGGEYADSVAVADVNGDGKPDLLVASMCSIRGCASGTVGVLLGNGDGTFQTAVAYSSGGYQALSIAVADVNGDGNPDLIVANACTDINCNSGGVVAVLINTNNVSREPTTTALASSPNPSTFGQTVTFTATVSGQGGTPTGTVSFFDGTTNLGDSPLNGSGAAAFAIPTLTVGTRSMTAVYNGDSNFAPSTSPVLYQVVQGATATLSPTNLNFGNQTVGIKSAPQVVTLTNTGTMGLIITSIQVSGANDGDFAQNNNCGTSVPPNGSCQISVTFTPTTTGTRNAAITIRDNAPGSPQAVPLTGVGVSPVVTLSPTSLNFGNQTVGITSSPQYVTLQNTGNINLTITSIQITGANSGDFAQTNNCPASLSPNNSCQISVTFTPTATGTRNAAVSITDNAPGSPQQVPLTGVGVLPAVTFNPTSLTFPTQLIYTTSKPQAVQLTNSGLGILLITKISVSGDFSQTNNCPSSLNPNAYCTINVKFHPKTKGVLNGSVNVKDNAPGSPQKVPLTGTGTYVQLFPTKLNFGVQPVGTKSLPKKISLTNQGHDTLNITSIAITGTDAGDFAETNNCGKQVKSGASCFIKVTFKPLAKGKRTADVSVYDDGGGSPQEVGLSGTGT